MSASKTLNLRIPASHQTADPAPRPRDRPARRRLRGAGSDSVDGSAVYAVADVTVSASSSTAAWERLSALPLVVEGCAFERRAAMATRDWERVTTLIRLTGAAAEGLGEDVSPFETEDDTLHVTAPSLPLAGEWTLGGFCERLAELDPWPVPPRWDVARRWRRWGFEAAALDLALRQAGRPLHEVVGRAPAPIRFVNSLGLGDPPTFEPIRRRLE